MSKEIKKELRELQERMDNLEVRQTVQTWKYGKVDLLKLARIVENLDKKSAVDAATPTAQKINRDN